MVVCPICGQPKRHGDKFGQYFIQCYRCPTSPKTDVAVWLATEGNRSSILCETHRNVSVRLACQPPNNAPACHREADLFLQTPLSPPPKREKRQSLQAGATAPMSRHGNSDRVRTFGGFYPFPAKIILCN